MSGDMQVLASHDGGRPLEGWTSLSWQHGLSQVGVGQVEGDRDAVNVVGQVKFAVEGANRFVFDVEDENATDGESRSRTWAGRGLAAQLERAIVLPSGYPAHTERTRKLSGAPMAIWLTLLGEAQARGHLTWLTPTFTASTSSTSQAWATNITSEIEPGTNLLQLLVDLTLLEDVEWRLNPDGTLDVAVELGTDLSGTVRLFLGRNQIEVGETSSTRKMRKTVYLEASTGVSEASGPAVDGEVWLESEDFADPTSRAVAAARLAELLGTPDAQVVVQVSPDVGLFDRFDVGDTISLDVDGVAEQARVLAVSVSQDDHVRVELTLRSRVELRQQRLEDAVQRKADVNLAAGASFQRRHGLISAEKILAGSLQVTTYIESSDYDPGLAGWRISGDGDVEFDRGTFRGDLSAAGGTFSGTLSGVDGTFSGDLSAAGGTFSGDLSAAGGTFSGTLSAVDGTFSGTLNAVDGTFGTISAGQFEGVLSLQGGSIVIDDNGIQLPSRSDEAGYTQIRWFDGATLTGYITAAPGFMSVIGTKDGTKVGASGGSVMNTFSAGASNILGNNFAVGVGGVSFDQVEHSRRSLTGLSYQVFRPVSDGQGLLGNGSRRWNQVFVVNAENVSSDERSKTIDGDAPGLAFVESLRPIAYRRKPSKREDVSGLDRRERVEKANGLPPGSLPSHVADRMDDVLAVEDPPSDDRLHFGFSAQELAAIVGEGHDIVHHDAETDSWGITYSELIAPLYRAVQELAEEVRRGR